MLSQALTGSLIRDPVQVTHDELRSISSLDNPPLIKLDPSDIHVRRCRLASDRMDSKFGRFRTDDLPNLLEMVHGAPVLVGHDRQTVGVARFFGGEVEEREGASWVIPSFYWPKAHSKAEDLRVMIDSGIYSEASISFMYQRPSCSICGKDLRECSHWPGKSYSGKLCFYWYDQIERVTEGSLVYRGAASGTGFELPNPALDLSENSAEKPSKSIILKHKGRRYTATLKPENR